MKVGDRVRTPYGDGRIEWVDTEGMYGVNLESIMGTFRIDEAKMSLIDPEMRTYCYRSPYPLMLTPEDADITDLLGAVLNLSMTYGEHSQSYSTEVMQAVGAVVALAKRSLKEEA